MVFSSAMVDGGWNTAKDPLYAAVGAFVLGGPTVHLSHGHLGRAAASLGLRAGLPAAVLTLSWKAATLYCDQGTTSQDACIGALFLMMTAGASSVTLAAGVDIAVLARDTVEVKPAFVPTVALTKNGGSIGVAGVF
jgi:hypothetical protein